MTTQVPEELLAWPGHTGSWHKWPNDRGALNLIDSEATLRGVRCVREGKVISCARTISLTDPIFPEIVPASHRMTIGRYIGTEDEVFTCGDAITFRTHGSVNTHIDAFSHLLFRGYAYNGRGLEEVVDMEQGALRYHAPDLLGIVTRGIFIDVARQRGVRGLMPGEFVTPEDLAPSLERFAPGDAAIIRTGVTLTGGEVMMGPDGKPAFRSPVAGFHPDCVEVLAERGISVLASDSPSDAYPTPTDIVCEAPVHTLCLVIHGIPLVHNMDLEELGLFCHESARSDCQFVVSALKFPRATGSGCTPVAIF